VVRSTRIPLYSRSGIRLITAVSWTVTSPTTLLLWYVSRNHKNVFATAPIIEDQLRSQVYPTTYNCCMSVAILHLRPSHISIYIPQPPTFNPRGEHRQDGGEHRQDGTDMTKRNPSYCFLVCYTKAEADMIICRYDELSFMKRPLRVKPGVKRGTGTGQYHLKDSRSLHFQILSLLTGTLTNTIPLVGTPLEWIWPTLHTL
jgi:hypothetical protein